MPRSPPGCSSAAPAPSRTLIASKTMSEVGEAAKAVGPRSQQELDALIDNGLAPILREWLRELPPKPPVDTPGGARRPSRPRGARTRPHTYSRTHALARFADWCMVQHAAEAGRGGVAEDPDSKPAKPSQKQRKRDRKALRSKGMCQVRGALCAFSALDVAG